MEQLKVGGVLVIYLIFINYNEYRGNKTVLPSLPLFQMVQHLDSKFVLLSAPSTFGAGGPNQTRLDSSTKKCVHHILFIGLHRHVTSLYWVYRPTPTRFRNTRNGSRSGRGGSSTTTGRSGPLRLRSRKGRRRLASWSRFTTNTRPSSTSRTTPFARVCPSCTAGGARIMHNFFKHILMPARAFTSQIITHHTSKWRSIWI